MTYKLPTRLHDCGGSALWITYLLFVNKKIIDFKKNFKIYSRHGGGGYCISPLPLSKIQKYMNILGLFVA